jgi:hypothetical protein
MGKLVLRKTILRNMIDRVWAPLLPGPPYNFMTWSLTSCCQYILHGTEPRHVGSMFRGIHGLDTVQTDCGVQPVMSPTESHTHTVLSGDMTARISNRGNSADFAIYEVSKFTIRNTLFHCAFRPVKVSNLTYWLQRAIPP